ncbi:hypothetical protein ACQY0O_004391 [Thecaphora frezii]
MQTTNASTLFQTDTALAQGAARALKASRTASGTQYGSPIWLNSRYKDATGLADSGAAADAGSARVLSLRCRTAPSVEAAGRLPQNQVWTAESGGVVRVTDLETGKTSVLFRGHTAPVPAFDLVQIPISDGEGKPCGEREVVVTGSWDKSIKVWPVPSSLAPRRAAPGAAPQATRPRALLTHAQAATDFVKAVHCFRSGGLDLLLSAGSDKTVRCWNLSPLVSYVRALSEQQWRQICDVGVPEADMAAVPGLELVATLRDHTRPINCLASVPPPPPPHAPATDQTVLFSADSMGRIFELVLDLQPSTSTSSASASTSPPTSRGMLTIRRELRAHETAIYDLRVGWRDEEIEGLNRLPTSVEAAVDEFATPVYEAADGSFRRYVAEVWTCSGDKTARGFVLSIVPAAGAGAGTAASGNAKGAPVLGSRSSKAGPVLGFQPPLGAARTVTHVDFVKSLVPLAHAGARRDVQRLAAATSAKGMLPPAPQWMVTGSSDEMLRVFDLDAVGSAASGASSSTAGSGGFNGSTNSSARLTSPLSQLEGHWHEIDAMDVWFRPSCPASSSSSPASSTNDDGGKKEDATALPPIPQGRAGEWYVVSSGLDGSVRRWSLATLSNPPTPPPSGVENQPASASASASAAGVANGNADKSVRHLANPTAPRRAGAAKREQSQVKMTEEEERELAELLGSDDE